MSASDDAGLMALQRLAETYHCTASANIDPAWLDPTLLNGLPVDYLRSGPVLPVRVDGEVRVCTPDPGIEVKFPELSTHLGGDLEPLLVPAEVIRKAIAQAFASAGAPEEVATEASPISEAVGVEVPKEDAGREDLLRRSEHSPVASRVNRILLEGLREGASDIHLEPVEGRLRVRFRLDGVLVPRDTVPAGQEDALVSRIKVMSRLDIAERRLPQDGNAKVRVGDREVDIRVSTLPVSDGERVVLRLLGRENTRFSLADLGMPPGLLAGFRKTLRVPHGVIWVTGPTGSGKTTTLYAALQELDTERQNILTIEDPVEYQLPGIGQVGVKPRIGFNFATGLRSLLRQDPDVILVGETRDEETAEIVVRASMTGHVVLSTLHANDAISAPVRVTDMGVEPFLVAEATRGSLAQRLVRRLCPHCAGEERDPQLPAPLQALAGQSLRKACGCGHCREGYLGRVGLFEWLPVGGVLREHIRNQSSMEEVRRVAEANGFEDLWHAAASCLQAGVTDLQEVESILGLGE
jgi:general secretion pathway protein E